MEKRWWIGVMILALVVAAGLTSCATGGIGGGTTHFSNLETNDLLVLDDLTVNDDTVFVGTTQMGSTLTGAGDRITVTDAIFVNGSTDQDQLTVQGYLTQTGRIFTVEYSTGVNVFEVRGDGSLRNNSGPMTVTDNIYIEGQADLVQLTVRGYTTQTSSLAVFETSAGTEKVTVDNAGNVVSAGEVDAVTFDASGEVQVGTFLNLGAATSITCTNGSPITPTGTYQVITAAGEVTPTISGAGFTAGDVLILKNASAQTINLVDSGNFKLSAAYAMTVDDTWTGFWDGADWVEVSRSAN